MRSHPDNEGDLWQAFTGRHSRAAEADGAREVLAGKRVLITGAGGYIGSALARRLAELEVAELVLLDVGELGLYRLELELDSAASGVDTRFVVGSVLDADLLREIFDRHRPQIVFHAAACKHVPMMERNPFTAVATNALGTAAMMGSARDANAQEFVLLSTDKAVDPVSIMGAAKRLAELLLLADVGKKASSGTRWRAVRLGNVLGSSGSVGPLFLEQIARGGPVTVSDASATRYLLPVGDAVEALIAALTLDGPSGVYVSNVGEPHAIADLARFLIDRSSARGAEIRIEYTGLRPGDKVEERMISEDESLEPMGASSLRLVRSKASVYAEMKACMERIEAAIHTRSLEELLGAIQSAVPRYRPSQLLARHLAERAGAGSR